MIHIGCDKAAYMYICVFSYRVCVKLSEVFESIKVSCLFFLIASQTAVHLCFAALCVCVWAEKYDECC